MDTVYKLSKMENNEVKLRCMHDPINIAFPFKMQIITLLSILVDGNVFASSQVGLRLSQLLSTSSPHREEWSMFGLFIGKSSLSLQYMYIITPCMHNC